MQPSELLKVCLLYIALRGVDTTRTRSGGDYGGPERRACRSTGSRYAPYSRTSSPTSHRRSTVHESSQRRTVQYPGFETVTSVISVSVITSTSVIVVTCPPPTTRARYNGVVHNPIVTATIRPGAQGQIRPSPVNSWQPAPARTIVPPRPRGSNSHNNSRWDSSIRVPPSQPRPPLPPMPSDRGTTSAPRPVLTGLPMNHILSLTDLSTPPPPEWQPFLRDLVVSLGYRRAASIWPRLARCRFGNYSEEVRREQEAYMLWCRETIIGFER